MDKETNYDPDEIESKYPVMDMPEFKSKIPAYLTEKLEKKELFIVESVSIIEQKVEWNKEHIFILSKAVIDLDKFKQWSLKVYNRILSKWTIIWVIAAWILSFCGKTALEYILKTYFKIG